jgi:hypothetical protein
MDLAAVGIDVGHQVFLSLNFVASRQVRVKRPPGDEPCEQSIPATES